MLFLYLFACGEKDVIDSGESSQLNVDTSEQVEENEESSSNNNEDQSEEDQSEENQTDEDLAEETDASEQDPEEERESSQSNDSTGESEEEIEQDVEDEEIENTNEPSNDQNSNTGNEICDVDDLVWNVRVLDENENAVSPYATTSSLSIVGEVTNNCDGELILSTMTDCIVYSGTLYANSGLGTHIWTNTCQVFSSSWIFGPYETKSQTETISSRPEDHYELTIYFADCETTMVQYGFDVE